MGIAIEVNQMVGQGEFKAFVMFLRIGESPVSKRVNQRTSGKI